MLKIFDTYKGLPKSVYIIFFAQVINRFGDFVSPFLALFLVNKMGLSFQVAGLAVTMATLASIPGAFAGGKVADHLGRTKTYAFFQGMAAISIFICAFFANPTGIIILVCLASFFNGGVRPIIGAIITDVLTPEKRPLGFSLSYLGINLGVALGPLVAGFLFNHMIAMIFIGDAITSFIAIALVVLNIKETKPSALGNASTSGHMEKHEEGNVFHVLWRRPQILIFLMINVLFAIVYTQHSFSVPLMLTEVFGGEGAKYYGFLMSGNAVTVLVMTMVVTGYTKSWHPLSSIAMAGVLYAIGFGMIGVIHSFSLFAISTFIWTVGEIMVVTNFGVYIANNTPQNFRARFNAVTSLSWSLGSVVGTAGMGRFMDLMGVKAVWPLVFVLALGGAYGMYWLKKKFNRVNSAEEVV